MSLHYSIFLSLQSVSVCLHTTVSVSPSFSIRLSSCNSICFSALQYLYLSVSKLQNLFLHTTVSVCLRATVFVSPHYNIRPSVCLRTTVSVCLRIIVSVSLCTLYLSVSLQYLFLRPTVSVCLRIFVSPYHNIRPSVFVLQYLSVSPIQ